MRTKFFLSATLGTLLAVTACGSSDGDSSEPTGRSDGDPSGMMNPDPTGDTAADPMPDEGPGNIVETAQAAGSFSSLLAAAEKAGLAETLATGGPFTVFAPTDEAFDAALAALGVTLDDLDADTLAGILTYHVVDGEVPASEVTQLSVATTLAGSDVRVRVLDGSVLIGAPNGDARVVTADVEASNGIIHVIDTVMLPPENIAAVATAAGFDSLVAAVAKAELVDTLANDGPFTVFAPTDEAFAEALDALGVTLDDLSKEDLTQILTYHVVPGKLYSEDVVAASSATTVQGGDVSIAAGTNGVTLNGDVNVVATDVLANNGVIHVVDKVLLPPMCPSQRVGAPRPVDPDPHRPEPVH